MPEYQQTIVVKAARALSTMKTRMLPLPTPIRAAALLDLLISDHQMEVRDDTFKVLTEAFNIEKLPKEANRLVRICEIRVEEWFSKEPTTAELLNEAEKREFSLVSPLIALQDASHRILNKDGELTWIYYGHKRVTVDRKEWSFGTGPSPIKGRLHLNAVTDTPLGKVPLGSVWAFELPS